MIWLALLIPLFTVIFLAWKFPKRMHIIEYVFVFGVPIFCIAIGKYTSVSSQTKDKEYWNEATWRSTPRPAYFVPPDALQPIELLIAFAK